MNQTTTTKPETFMLTADQLDNLPVEAKQALEQVDDVSIPRILIRSICVSGADCAVAQVLSRDSARELASRPDHSTLSPPDRRVCELCFMEVSTSRTDVMIDDGLHGHIVLKLMICDSIILLSHPVTNSLSQTNSIPEISSMLQVQTLSERSPIDSKRSDGQYGTSRNSKKGFFQTFGTSSRGLVRRCSAV